MLYVIGWNGKLVNKTDSIRIYVELDYLYDSFCENNTYIQIYIKNRHIYHYIYIYCKAYTDITTFTKLHEHLQQNKAREKYSLTVSLDQFNQVQNIPLASIV